MNILALLSRLRDVIALLIAFLLSLVLMNSADHPSSVQFRYGMSRFISLVSTPLSFAVRSVDIWSENRDLRQQLIELKGEQQKWRDSILENHRLREMLGFSPQQEFNYLACEITAQDPSLNLSGVILDRGAEDGIQKGQAVITADGLAGVVLQAHQHSTVVQLITDGMFAAGVRCERSRVDGIIRYIGNGELRMDDVPANLDVEKGDRIITSGLGSMIPGGIPVGVVSDIERKKGKIFSEIIVQPFVAYRSLEEVFVMVPAETESDSIVAGP